MGETGDYVQLNRLKTTKKLKWQLLASLVLNVLVFFSEFDLFKKIVNLTSENCVPDILICR